MIRILLVDDDADFTAAVRGFFVGKPVQLCVLGIAQLSVDGLRAGRYDLALLDLDLPRRNVIEIIGSARECGIDIPIIALCSNALTPDTVAAMRHGADECLDKPIDVNTLGEVVSTMLAGRRGSLHYLAAKVDSFLRENCGRDLRLHDVCERFQISSSYVMKLMKNHIGCTYSRRLAFYRIQRAKKLLRSTDLRVYEIADKCGYAHCPRFNEVFKRLESVSPTRYRRSVMLASLN